MSRRAHLVAGALAAVVTMTLAAIVAPASGETVARADARGDAPARIDITRARYTHSDDRVSVVARVPDLGPAGTAALSISRFEIFEAGYVVRIRQRPGLPSRTRLFFFNHFELQPRRCDDVSGVWGEHVVRLSVARSCLTGHARRRVFTQVGVQHRSDVDRAPAVKRLRRS